MAEDNNLYYYHEGLGVKLSHSDQISISLSFHSNKSSLPINRWTTLTDIDDINEITGQMMVLIDLETETKNGTLVQNISDLQDKQVVAIICISSGNMEDIFDCIAKLDEKLNQNYPQLLFLEPTQKNKDLQELLLENPAEVQCLVSEKMLAQLLRTQCSDPQKDAINHNFSNVQSHKPEQIVESTLNILFMPKNTKEHEKHPLSISDNPELYVSLISFIHQKEVNYASDKKMLRNTLNKICKYFRSTILHHDHISTDFAIYLIILREIQSIFLKNKEDKQSEADLCISYILENYTKLQPFKIEKSIKNFNSIVSTTAVTLFIDHPRNHLFHIFTSCVKENSNITKSGIKSQLSKSIIKLSDLENRLMWYSIIMICQQTFVMPGHSNWFDSVINKIESSAISIFDASVQHSVRINAFEFGESLSLDINHKFSLSDLIKWISYERDNFHIEQFIRLLEFLIEWKYSFHELDPFFKDLFNLFFSFDRNPKLQLTRFMDNDPNIFASLSCHMMSCLAKLLSSCVIEIERFPDLVQTVKSSWFKLFKYLLDKMISFYLPYCRPQVYSSFLRSLYTKVKIPTTPANIFRPWIRDYKAYVKNAIIRDMKKYDIETFFAIYNEFKIQVLGIIFVQEYFNSYQPTNTVSLADDIWQILFNSMFSLDEFPKSSLFCTLIKIFKKYLELKKGFEFIKLCFTFDLPSYGMHLEDNDLSDSNIHYFIDFVEKTIKTNNTLRLQLQSNLMGILDYITPLRLPSLLYLTLMDPICKGITPEHSIIATSDKNHIQIKHIMISLNEFCHKSLTASITLEQISTSVMHIFVFKLLNSLILSLNISNISYSSFPAILIPILLFYDKYTKLLPGFNGYDWKNNDIKSYIESCKIIIRLIILKYERIISMHCTLREYNDIEKNLPLINEVFKYSDRPTVSSAEIDAHTLMFTRCSDNIKKFLFSDLSTNSNEIVCLYFIEYLQENQIEIPQIIENETDALFTIVFNFRVPGEVNLKSLTFMPKNNIPLIQFQERCNLLYNEFRVFTTPIQAGSDVNVKSFLDYFASRNNSLFNACLRKSLSVRVNHNITQGNDNNNIQKYLTIDDFSCCAKESFSLLIEICKGETTYAEIEAINQYLPLENLYFEKVHKELKGFPLFTAIIQNELRVVDMFRLLKIADFLPHLIDVCKTFKLANCVNSNEFLTLQTISVKLKNENQRAALTLQHAANLLGDILTITCKMPITRFPLFPLLTSSFEFYRFLKEYNFHKDKANFDTQLNLITSDKQGEGEFNDTILSHLQIAYNFMMPLFDPLLTANSFFKLYSEMNIGEESKYSQLQTVNNNILLIRRWFIQAEGETADNLSQQLHDILNSGSYTICLGVDSNSFKTDSFQNDMDQPTSYLREVACNDLNFTITLIYSASTKASTNITSKMRKDRVEDVTNDLKSVSNDTIEERMDMLKIDEFVRKLSFLEQDERNKGKIHDISIFQSIHNSVQQSFEILSTLYSLGHPEYQNKQFYFKCDNAIEIFDKKLCGYNKVLIKWKKNYEKIQKDSIYLLFFPIKRIISIVTLLDKQRWCMVCTQILFLMQNYGEILTLLEAKLQCIYFVITSKLIENAALISPVEKLAHLLREITTAQLFCESLSISSKSNSIPLTSHGLQSKQSIYRVFSYSKRQLLNLLAQIYNFQKGFKSFEILKCHQDITQEELTLFLKRTKIFTSNTYTLLEVNCLPNYLQEYTMQHIAESHKDKTPIANINYIETAQSLLHELPGIKVISKESIKTISDEGLQIDYVRFDLLNKQNVFKRIELVYGLDGNGKSHYIWNEIRTKKYIVIAINEAFNIPSVIQKMVKLDSFDKDVCIYFNVTITCLEPDNKEYNQFSALMHKLNWFFFDILALNHISDSNSSLTFSIPSGLGWNLFVEVPSRLTITNPELNISKFLDDIPILHIVRDRKCIGNQPYVVDEGVQLVCKYLYKYDLWRSNKEIGINQLFVKDKVIKFSTEPDLCTEKCLSLLEEYMNEHVKKRKIMQKLFVSYMIRRCNVLEHLPQFNYNTGTGIYFDSDNKKVFTNTTHLGSTLFSTMLFEVNSFCDSIIKEDWPVKHQQLIYDYRSGGHAINFLSLKPELLQPDERKNLSILGVSIPDRIMLGNRDMLEKLLCNALSLDNQSIVTNLINEESYILTVDFLLKMLNIHERKMCRYPVVIEGETGVGKTKLLEMLSKLWNKTVHQKYYTTVSSIVDLLKKKIDELCFGQGATADSQTDMSAIFDLHDKIIANICPSMDVIEKSCYILGIEIINIIQVFSSTPAFYLFQLNFNAVKRASYTKDVKDISQILQSLLTAQPLDTFYKINVHSALTPDDIKAKFNVIINLANMLSENFDFSNLQDYNYPTVTVFLDEINTSSCIGLFKEIIIDGSIDGEPLPQNIFVVSACNPHRSSTVAVRNDTIIEDWILGWYFVRPLHPTLSRILWDYGSLNDAQEEEYIKQKLSTSSLSKNIPEEKVTLLGAEIAYAQQLVRGFALTQLTKVGFSLIEARIRSKSSVSQRDIQRVFTISEFIYSLLEQNDIFGTLQKAVIVAIGLVYYFRLDSYFRTIFSESIYKQFNIEFRIILYEYITKIVNNVQVPVGIAKTIALQENLFATIICLICKIPLIIVGAPGTSKTLSFNLAISNVKGLESPNEYFRDSRFPALEPFYYQCSRKSTSIEIENVFKIAIARQSQLDEAKLPVFSVVFMDEAGLPEESHESLKALHYYLDRPKVSFIAISNHILDAAKSNRAINLFRPHRQDQNDLLELAKGCFNLYTQVSIPDCSNILNKICNAYKELITVEPFANFFGLRDFIHLISYFRRFYHIVKSNDMTISEDLILRGLERNFNGLERKFYDVADFFIKRRIVSEKLRGILSILKESLRDKSIRPFAKQQKTPANLEKIDEVRFKMIIDPSDDDSLTRLLFHYDILNLDESRIFIGSDFPGDGELQKIILISAIKHAAAQGKTIILCQADDFYESFYDLFNQNYKYVDVNEERRYYANIAIGSHSKQCRVGPDFQCIVHVNQSNILDLPKPFLNRFEKFYISQESLLDSSLRSLPVCMSFVVNSSINKVKEFLNTLGKHSFYGEISQSLTSLLIDTLPNPDFKYDQHKEVNCSDFKTIDSTLDVDEEEHDLLNLSVHPIIDIIIHYLKELAGFNFIYFSEKQRDEMARDCLIIAAQVEEVDLEEANNLSRVCLSDPYSIEQFVRSAINHLMLETAPATEEMLSEGIHFILPVTVSAGERLVIAFIAHFMIRYLVTRLLQLALPEAIIVKLDKINKTYYKSYLTFQNHFHFKELVANFIALRENIKEKPFNRPSKLVCYTRTTSFLLSLPVIFPSNNHNRQQSIDIGNLIYHNSDCENIKNRMILCKLSAIKTQEAFLSKIRTFYEDDLKSLFIILADMQFITRQRINFVRLTIDQEEHISLSKCENSRPFKTIAIIIHYPPSIFNKPLPKGKSSTFHHLMYPANFNSNWDHYYLDNLQKISDDNPIDISEWLRITMSHSEVDDTNIREKMLKSLFVALPKSCQEIVCRIQFGNELNCIFNSDSVPIHIRITYLKQLFNITRIGEILCNKFSHYWKPQMIREQVYNFSYLIFERQSSLSLSDLIVTNFWHLFSSFLTLMIYKMNENLNLETVFVQSLESSETGQAILNSKCCTLFVGILERLPSPNIEELNNISHMLNYQSVKSIHVPSFPFYSLISSAFDDVIQSTLHDINTNVSKSNNSIIGESSEKKYAVVKIKKVLFEKIKITIEKNEFMPMLSYALNFINENDTFWTLYTKDFAFANLTSTSSLISQEDFETFQYLIENWSKSFKCKILSDGILSMHISCFFEPPDFSRLLNVFISLQRIDSNFLSVDSMEAFNPLVESLMLGSSNDLNLVSSLSTLSLFIKKLSSALKNVLQINNKSKLLELFHEWLILYYTLLIASSGFELTYFDRSKLQENELETFTELYAVYTIAKLNAQSDEMLICARDFAIEIFGKMKNEFNFLHVLNDGVRFIRTGCQQMNMNSLCYEVEFIENMLVHYFEEISFVKKEVIEWILSLANLQSSFSNRRDSVSNQVVGIILQECILTFRTYQYFLSKLLHSNAYLDTDYTDITNIAKFNPQIKHFIGIELLKKFHPPINFSEYLPYYYTSHFAFIISSSDRVKLMNQPLAHLYYQICFDKLIGLYGNIHFLKIWMLFKEFIEKSFGIDKDPAFLVTSYIEKQALFQIVIRIYSVFFNHKLPNSLFELMQRYPKEIQELHGYLELAPFGGGKSGGHSWTILHYIAENCRSTSIFEQYLEKLKNSKELKWFQSCLNKVRSEEKLKLPLLNFANPKMKNPKYKIYYDCSDYLKNIAISFQNNEDISSKISLLSQYISNTIPADQPFVLMSLFLGIYQHFFLYGLKCLELYEEMKSGNLNILSSEKLGIILCFLNPDLIIRSSEFEEILNPNEQIYEEIDDTVKLKPRKGNKVDYLHNFFVLSHCDPIDNAIRNVLANFIAIILAIPEDCTHLTTLIFAPENLSQTYMVGNLYPKTIQTGLKYDCGCELNEEGNYGRPDYFNYDRKSFTLHSFYFITFMNFGAFCIGLISQPQMATKLKNVISEWIQPRQYCLSQLRTIWIHMTINLNMTVEELSDFLTTCFYDFFLCTIGDRNIIHANVFKSLELVEKYEKKIHNYIFEPNYKKNKDIEDKSSQIISEFSKNVLLIKNCCPDIISFSDLLHSIEANRQISDTIDNDSYVILHRFISERKRFRIGAILISKLIKFYRLLHNNLNYFISRNDAEEKTIVDVLSIISKKYSHILNTDINDLYNGIEYYYNEYVKVCRGLIGLGPCAAIRREHKLLNIDKNNTKFVFLLSDHSDVSEGNDSIFILIQDLIDTQNTFLNLVYENLPKLKWYNNGTNKPTEIMPTEDNTRNSFISDLTANELSRYWSSLETINEQSLSIFDTILSRTTYSPYTLNESSKFDLFSLEKDIFWKYISNKPKINADFKILRKTFKFKEQLLNNIPDPLNLNQFLNGMRQHLSSNQDNYLEGLNSDILQNLDFHFHNLDYPGYCNILNALRQSISKLAQESMVLSLYNKNFVQNTFGDFLCQVFKPFSSKQAMINVGFDTLSEDQQDILENDIKVKNLFSCLEYFIVKFELRSYDYYALPFNVKAKIPESLILEIEEFLTKFHEKEKNEDKFKKELESLLTTLQHCETSFAQTPQDSIKDTLINLHFYGDDDIIIMLFPNYLQNAHYVNLVGILQSKISCLKDRLSEKLKGNLQTTHEWKEKIENFWSLLPHFWNDDHSEKNDSGDLSIDFLNIHDSKPLLSLDMTEPPKQDVSFQVISNDDTQDAGADLDFDIF